MSSAFASRIRTGTIVNLRHVDALTFLEDSMQLFKTRVYKILREMVQIKANVTFSGEFERESADVVERALKHFSTANQVIDGTTDIAAWWSQHVQDDVIVQLEDFQQRASG